MLNLHWKFLSDKFESHFFSDNLVNVVFIDSKDSLFGFTRHALSVTMLEVHMPQHIVFSTRNISKQLCLINTLLAAINLFSQISSRLEVFCKNGVFGNFAKFTAKHLCPSVFLIN